jgi:beta-phosphoglucomutase-like phosphatase (HAD superfamily)
MALQFFYFDMGNVLLYFSHEKMAEQMARVVGIQPEQAWKILFEGALEGGALEGGALEGGALEGGALEGGALEGGALEGGGLEGGGLEWAYERGELTREQFYGRFCEAAGARRDVEALGVALDDAGNDIFDLNPPIIGLVGRLAGAGYRLGVCSNTSQSHWGHCVQQYRALSTTFPVHALSFRLKAMKPDPAFYAAATKLTGVAANQVFFTDDRPENVAAAIAAGWDAVLYKSVSQLNEALRSRGVVINY